MKVPQLKGPTNELLAPAALCVLMLRLVSLLCLPQIDKAPELIRPSSCAVKSVQLKDPANEPNVNSWLPVCQQAQQECAATAKRDKPWLKCTYTSLSTFWEIQRWIRNNGAVVTR